MGELDSGPPAWPRFTLITFLKAFPRNSAQFLCTRGFVWAGDWAKHQWRIPLSNVPQHSPELWASLASFTEETALWNLGLKDTFQLPDPKAPSVKQQKKDTGEKE